MLTQLVRPLVRTQIKILANSRKAEGQLVTTIVRWLGYLGVHAEVKQLKSEGNYIQVSLSVGKPEQCSEEEWQQILESLKSSQSLRPVESEITYQMMSKAQQLKACRLLAHIIQVGNPNAIHQWEHLQNQLMGLAIDAELIQGIHSAIKVPQFLDSLLDNLETDVATFVLTRAFGIALIDKKISLDEENALKSIYLSLENPGI